MKTSIFIHAASLILQARSDEEETRSYSDSWNLLEEDRKIIRQEGYCSKLCGLGAIDEADGWDGFIQHYHRMKGSEDFLTFQLLVREDIIDENTELGSEFSEVETLEERIDIYCEWNKFNSDECLELEKSMIIQERFEKCADYCFEQLHELDIFPEFEDMSEDRKKFEKCQDDFGGPNDVFDHNNNDSVEDMLRTWRRNGYIVVKNFFSHELMNEVHEFMNKWDDFEYVRNLTYSEFYSTDPGQLNQYENRLEIVLPYVYPFDSMLYNIHNSSIMDLMKEYAHGRDINMDFPASIMSRPGAEEQSTHGDHSVEAGMIKLSVAIHDIHEKSGPTSFCPCTHQYGIAHNLFNKNCAIRYHPKLITAGSITIYDQCMKHRGSANNGDIRRYILDLSYNVDQVFNTYEKPYPRLAQEHVLRYREDFQNL